MKKICHLTSVHNRYDTRIFHKECKSLVNSQYQVFLIVADNKGNENIDNINIIDVGDNKINNSRMFRMIITVFKIFKEARILNADLYHFHDPELIFVGILLRMYGKKVIFDIHEDVPKQLLNKHYFSETIGKTVSKLYEMIEKFSLTRFSFIITSTEYINNRISKIQDKCKSIKNYPLLSEFSTKIHWSSKSNEIIYLGAIEKVRGLTELISALKNLSLELNLAGKVEPKEYLKELKQLDGWSKVKLYGFVSRQDATKILDKSKIGIVTLHPIENYIDALPVKLFEYMASGIPVIASDFKLWKNIVYGDNCGICVNPHNIKEIENAIKFLLSNDETAQMMGKNGRKAVEKKYNWENEEKKLLRIYDNLLSR